MITITLPDKSVRQFDSPPTGDDIARSISDGLWRSSVAMELDGVLCDLSSRVDRDAAVRLITTRDKEALEIMRHSAAHIMAEAVQHLFEKAELTIGPVVADGFYYDIDMEPVSEEVFPKIEAEIQAIIKNKTPFVRREVSREEALRLYQGQKYKTEIIEGLEGETISIYTNGDFSDLCRGPHVPHTGFIGAIKLMKVSGAYWRADQQREQLQRLYGTAFFTKKELNAYLELIEEAKKRDHRKIGAQLDLFSFHQEAAGMPFFHPRGMVMWNILLDYWRQEHKAAGYVEVKTPVMLDRKLWERSGHWENYRENMYISEIEGSQYAIKPMNCPGGMLLYNEKIYSYRELPLRAAEIGLVHRHELSGVLSGLFRVRAFHQDDAHIFMMPDQIEPEILGVLRLVERIYGTFGLGFHLELSTRPKKSIGTDEQWEKATRGLKGALETYGKGYQVNEGDGAFYGPKIDIHIKDAIGRTWQCGTIQLDMSLPERFDLSYIDHNNSKQRPVMIHRVVYGSIERFFGILIEHFAGKFPLWLAPVQAVLLPMNDALISFAGEIRERLENSGIRTEVDSRTESLNKKVREAQLNKIPLVITLGDREKESGTLSVRTLEGKVRQGVTMEAFLDRVCAHIRGKSRDPEIF
ncbi:MAG: threonine--tRNA ligase [Thermodesulfobacteriota bacterium]